MPMPNFLILGAPKAGTTALYYELIRHPQIFMPSLKEPWFFAYAGSPPRFAGPLGAWSHPAMHDLDAYRALFDGVGEQRAIGEASPIYLYAPDAASNIARLVPGARMIAILRDPAERAFSAFCHSLRDGVEPLRDFRRALDAEAERVATGWPVIYHYVGAGFYAAQLRRYLERFDRSQLRIYLYEDLERDPKALIREILGFLDVDTSFAVREPPRVNATGLPRSRALSWAYRVVSKDNPVKRLFKPLLPVGMRKRLISRTLSAIERRNLVRPELPPALRRELIGVYRQDVLELQDLLGRDLSAWLS